MIDLGTLPGGIESLGIYVNDFGQVIGFSTVGTTQDDPVGFIGFSTHGFVWEDGEKTDIGTLGGADSFPGADCGRCARLSFGELLSIEKRGEWRVVKYNAPKLQYTNLRPCRSTI